LAFSSFFTNFTKIKKILVNIFFEVIISAIKKTSSLSGQDNIEHKILDRLNRMPFFFKKTLILVYIIANNCIIRVFTTSSNRSRKLIPNLSVKLLSNVVLSLTPLLYSLESQALSATTTKVIQGSEPYFTFDNGVTKEQNLLGLLGITLSNNMSYIAPNASNRLYSNAIIDVSRENNPIELPNKTDTFSSIKTIVPIESYPVLQLERVIGAPNNYWQDDDGDTYSGVNGSLMIKWQDKKGKDITSEVKAHPDSLLNICDAPYKITLSVTNGNISTQYGIPKTKFFDGSSHSYYIKPKIDKPKVCFAQPNLYKQAGDESATNWVRDKGFIVQPFTQPTNNFPTTGLNKLFFYLLLGGITPEQVIAVNGKNINGTGTGVKLHLSVAMTSNWDGRYPDGDKALKIELIGPNRLSPDKAFTPSEFKLYSDSIGGHLLYNFKIERWYIALPGEVNYINSQKFCHELGNGYRVPDINDYTNANRTDTDFSWAGGIPGRDSNHYQRRLSYRAGSRWIGGLFNEWGFTFNGHYPEIDLDNYNCWASQSIGGDQFNVDAYNGFINHNYPTNTNGRAVCVKP
jgi:hypothetical protein